MSLLPSIASTLVDWLAETSLQVALLVVALLLIETLFFKAITARSRAALWGLVLVRLALPTLPIPLPASADPRLVARVTHVERPEAGAVPRPEGARAKSIPEPRPEAKSRVVTRVSEALAPRAPSAESSLGHSPSGAAIEESPTPESRSIVVLVLWLAGACLAGVVLALRELRFRRRLSHARRIVDEDLSDEVAAAAAAMELNCEVEVLETDWIDGPAVTGVTRPRLLLPVGFASTYGAEARHCILLHELAHLRRRDSLWNVVFTVVRAVFWFHPFVHIALRRLCDAREALRDRDALSAKGAPAPQAYAKTLLEALERGTRDGEVAALAFLRGQEWKRRFAMIQSFGKSVRLAKLASCVLVLGTGSLVLVGTAAPGLAVQVKKPPTKIRVEGYAEPPQWQKQIDAKLAEPLNVKFDGIPLRDALAQLKEMLKINITEQSSIDDGTLDQTVVLEATNVTGDDVLTVLARQAGNLDVERSESGIVIGAQNTVHHAVESRFYSVGVLFEGLGPDEIAARQARLLDLAATFIGSPGVFDRLGYSMTFYKNLLVITADSQTHESAREFLERLATPIADYVEKPIPRATWQDDLDARLEKIIDADLQTTTVAEFGEWVRHQFGVTFVVPPEYSGEPVTVHLEKVSLRAVIGSVAQHFDRYAVADHGVIEMATQPPLAVEMFDVADLVVPNSPEDGDMPVDQLDQLIRQQVRPQTWDVWPGVSVSHFGGRMIVRQSRPVLDELRSMLAALHRALGSQGASKSDR